MTPLWIPAGALSLLTLVVYGADKLRGQKKRIPEAALLLLSFLGGAAGGILAMLLFRHKTRLWYFWAVNLAALGWQLTAVWVFLS